MHKFQVLLQQQTLVHQPPATTPFALYMFITKPKSPVISFFTQPQSKTLIFHCSSNPKSLHQIKQSHARLITAGHGGNTGQLLAALAHSPSPPFRYSLSILNSTQNPSIFNINNLIRCFTKTNSPQKALFLYSFMRQKPNFRPNNHTFPFLFQACSKWVNFDGFFAGIQLHGHVIKHGCYENVYVRNGLIRLYFVFCENECARQVFDEMPGCRDLVTWNVMMAGYGKTGRVEDVERLFDEMPERDVVSWSTLITGYVRNGYLEQGLDSFKRMTDILLVPNEAVLVTVLSACGQLGLIETAVMIHSIIDSLDCNMTVHVWNGLVDMYAKCGYIDKACHWFDKMPEKDTSSWNVMICGLATHGLGMESIEHFKKLLTEGYVPDNVTFIGVLSACSKVGLVNEGYLYFKLMTEKYQIVPEMEHYGCMVDLLARAGLVNDAIELVENMPMEPDPVLWVTILDACRTHGLVELGEKTGKKLIELDPNRHGSYVQLSSVYARSHKWEEVVRTQGLIARQNNNKKVPGWSLIEAQGNGRLM